MVNNNKIKKFKNFIDNLHNTVVKYKEHYKLRLYNDELLEVTKQRIKVNALRAFLEKHSRITHWSNNQKLREENKFYILFSS